MKPIRLVLSRPEEKLAATASRYWGNPAFPPGYSYPFYVDDEGDEYPYYFLCQINLEDLARFAPENPLPHKGLLSFFAKIDTYLGEYAATECIGGYISGPEAVKVLYFPDCADMEETVLLDEDDNETSPGELAVEFSFSMPYLEDEHMLFAPPTHREWESWDHPFENWVILLQTDSFEGEDFSLNFMDCGVLDFLISPDDLKSACFDNVRGIVLST